MTATVKLPSGKLINLSRFVALLPDEETTEEKYKLSLAGLNKTISIDSIDAEFIGQKLKLRLDTDKSHLSEKWDREVQLRKNQSLMKLIEQWRENRNGKPATEEELQEYQNIQEALKRNRFVV